jgi:hypothetical protein
MIVKELADELEVEIEIDDAYPPDTANLHGPADSLRLTMSTMQSTRELDGDQVEWVRRMVAMYREMFG